MDQISASLFDADARLPAAALCGAGVWAGLRGLSRALSVSGRSRLGWALLAIAGAAVAVWTAPRLGGAGDAAGATLAALLLAAAAFSRFADQRGLARLRDVSDAALEALAVCENDRVAEVSPRFEALTGVPRARALGRPITDLAPAFAGPLALDTVCFEATLRDAAGETAPVEVLRRPLDGAGGRVVFAIHDLRDRRPHDRPQDHGNHCDPLTGVPDRSSFARAFDRRLAEAAQFSGSMALLVIDLVEFTDINDRHGHHAGDDALRRIGARLNAQTERGVAIGRLNGDVFGALAATSADEAEAREQASTLAETLLEEVQRPIEEWPDIAITARIGGVMVRPVERDLGFANALARAEAALARAKRSLGAPIRLYDEEIDDSIRLRRALSQDLRGAIERDELLLHYQPQVNVASGAITGYEALLRWAHPERGLVSPADFIPIAEETGLISPIGAWALRRACLDAAGWPDPLRVAVNLSPVQMRSPDLIETVRMVLDESGLSPERLELEVTESTIIEDMDHAVRLLNDLKALGLTIAIDDFGTGFASLATLQSFPFDKLKLDRTFLANMNENRQSAAIVRAVLALGDTLEMRTLAEGVETEAQLATLRELGCCEAQGYLLGRPAPLEKLPTPRAPDDAEPAEARYAPL